MSATDMTKQKFVADWT